MDLSEYALDPLLNNDAEFALYRGYARRPETPSVLLLIPVSVRPARESLKKLEHEYSLRSELDAAWAVRPLALSKYKEQQVLVLEDPGGEPLHRLMQGPMEMSRFLRSAIGLAVALSHLHKKDLIHKDVKPRNVLIDSQTNHAWLMGFGITSRLPRQRQSADPPDFIAGTLPYMAPEQTGRMNRSIDSRSDLYAFGVTLYEMLTGRLPFTASDSMEWVHCHIARQPTPPREVLEGIPAVVSAILMKLLAKTAEERYQTAAGVESDLRRCLADWETQSCINEFALGEHDTPDHLLIPEKLYGRDAEINTLLTVFDRVLAGGSPELVLVSGYSGIGKSAVVNELHRPVVTPRGFFASGKFDQYKRDIPYATLAQAFQSLIRPLLGKSEAELSEWRKALQEALDPNGQLIADLVPELKLIIGEQPPVPELSLQEAQGRFQLVFRRFISVFARPEHPLALFLDDLQWLDAATLDLLEDLLTRTDVHNLMLIGAYRDNEVDPSHPLMRKLQEMRRAGAKLQDIVLTPLTPEDLGHLLGDSLHCDLEHVIALAQLVHGKTTGNPFFAIQFISALAEEGLLTFDHGEGRWSWDLNRIHAKGYTDNVVHLMVGKLSRLPVETQNALQQLACMGNSAEFALLRMVYQGSEEKMHGQLWEAVRAGLIFRSADSYRFLHDRVQEAAYSLIPEESRAEVHLRIGRLLAAHTPPEKREEAIFEIVNQLNRGAALISSRDEREQLAELNLIAGKRAKASTAYTSALKYLIAGAALLDDSWGRRPELIFLLELHRAECEFLTGQSAAAEERLIMLSSRTANRFELATVTGLRVDLYTALDQSDRAVAVCLDYLRHLGIEWSPHPTKEEVEREYERIWSWVGSRKIDELLELPLMSDPASLATLDVLTKVLPPALFTDTNFLSLVICRAVNLSLEHGNSDGSCVAYVWLGQVAGPHFGNYKAGFQFGRLGYELVEKCGLKRFQARTYMVFGSHVMPWTKHVLAGRDLIHRTFEVANKIGDLSFAVYSCINLNTNLLVAGDPLMEGQREVENGLEFAQKAGFGSVIDFITVQLGLIRMLRGVTSKFGSFDDEQFDELRFERHLASDPALAQSVCFYWIRKLQARVFAADYVSALAASLKAEPLLWTAPSNLEMAEYHLYGGLCRAALWDSTFPRQNQEHFEALATHHRQLEVWAENCPENFENRAALISAEIARIQGRELDAEHLYEQAIHSSRANGFVHNEALANELTARFYAGRGFERIARAYLRDARYCYLRWGADGKVRQLDQLYPYLKDEEPLPGPTSTIVAPVEHLDLATVIKVSQAVSGQIVLEKLIDTLMRIAIEHAGAERGLLILPQGDERRTETEATTSGDTVIVRLRESSVAAAALPESIVHYVVRTQESVILDDASVKNPFSADPYIAQHHTRSILCLPLINRAKLIGVLYLENNLTPHVFTSARIALLKVLASQAAISLENTRLYHELEQREAKIRRLVDANIMGIFIWNLAGEITEANEAFLHMLGYRRNDLVSGSMRWTDLTPAEWHERDARAVAVLQETGRAQPYEKEFFKKDGSRVPVLAGGALFEENGSEGVGFVLDLSEQKRSEESHRVVVETASDAVISIDENGLILLTNPATRRIFGYGPTELLGKRLTILMPLSMRKKHEDGFSCYLASGQRNIDWRGTELTGLRKNGQEFPIEVSFGELNNNGRRVFTGFIRDISERKQAEEALRRSEAYLAQAQKVAHVGSWVWQVTERKAVYISDEWYRIYGFDPQGGMPTWEERLDRVHPEDRTEWKAAIDRAIDEKSDYDVEFRFLSPHSAVRYIHSVGRPVFGPSGELVQYVGIAMDVTENRRAEEERERLRQAQADIAHMNRVSTMGELTASLAHEIKQPIAAAVTDARTCLRWLRRDQPNLMEAQGAASRLIEDVTRASEIINRISLPFKKGALQRELIEVNQVIHEMIALLRVEAARYSIAIHSELTNGLPRIRADRVQVQQVLMNLMLNGIEAMKDIGSGGELTIKSQKDDGHILVSVHDTGVGLRPEHAEQIFNAFFTTKPQGTGMGLAISRSIIESHGGRLSAIPNDGPGATFQFTLPVEVTPQETA